MKSAFEQAYDRAKALRDGRITACARCGADAPDVRGQVPRCKQCLKVRHRPDAEIDAATPWEQDVKARRIVSEFGGLSRHAVVDLMGVTPEAIRLVEARVVERLRGAFEAAGITHQLAHELISRAPLEHPLDEMGGE